MPTNSRNEPFIDWSDPQNARNQFSTRLLSAYFANEWGSDVIFYAPKDNYSVPVHALIVATGSPMLERCCYGTETHKATGMVIVPEFCSAEVLEVVLRYLYAGGTPDGITQSNAFDVFQMAVYFGLADLQRRCEHTITTSLSVTDVCSIFGQILNHNTTLKDSCLAFITDNAKEVIANGTLMAMDFEALAIVLDVDNPLDISSDLVLVKPMADWAKTQCTLRSIEASPAHLREILGKHLKLIHFGAMAMEEFMSCVTAFGPGFFSHEEISLTVQQIYRRETPVGVDDTPYPFSASKRATFRVDSTFDGYTSLRIQDAGSMYMRFDVQHLGYTFKMIGMRVRTSGPLLITNRATGDVVEHSNRFGHVRFASGIGPDRQGGITLGIDCASNSKLYQELMEKKVLWRGVVY